ncbi:sugar-specific transcriptional regulator TrmB [Methanospirillum stamsii]|uniref:Sugar-specific transcriptional regulator TrmB n=2 Tax=Methanospirillum stamsii TaxID=1277351 RepID=A0A2V2N6W3_9EURY|nr:sugar-specific transcriptional regulator TrmB [Methanospirillum stamsii]
MQGVIERRRSYLQLMRKLTLRKGSFTVEELAQVAGIPRSTARDWISRLADEGCLTVMKHPHGRAPSRYAAVSAIPRTACRKIFTAVDGDMVEIVHECLSSACAAFCGRHHAKSHPSIRVIREGTILREFIRMGTFDNTVGLWPEPAVAITGVWREGDEIVQRIRSLGGPAHSLTGMMGRAEGVLKVDTVRHEHSTEGCIRTQALEHIIIGIDNTDSLEEGATFALAISLLDYLSELHGTFPIGHHIAMLWQDLPEKTAGNSCSAIELAVVPDRVELIRKAAVRFISDESISDCWGIAIHKGFIIPDSLHGFGIKARTAQVSCDEARACARDCGIYTAGGTGIIGSLAAIGLAHEPADQMITPAF